MVRGFILQRVIGHVVAHHRLLIVEMDSELDRRRNAVD